MKAVVDIGKLLDAVTAEGGITKAAIAWKVDAGKINMLLRGEIPRLDSLNRICIGAKLKPSELIHAQGAVNARDNRPRRVSKINYL